MPAVAGRGTHGRTASVTTALTSPTITGASGTFDPGDVGRTITGTGIPANTTITAVASSTSATMSANATASGTITATLGAGNAQTLGFHGWSPQTDAENQTYKSPSATPHGWPLTAGQEQRSRA